MSGDHLDRETSIAADVTPTGVQAKAKSRAVAAIDRLVGNIVEIANAPLEARNSERRAVAKARTEIIEALGEATIERLGTDPIFAEAAMKAHFNSIFEKIENKKQVASVAIEDLRRNPPTEEQSNIGSDTLSEEFMSRFERFSEDATEEHLRVKWGKILAAEIRKPGSISRKSMRIVDELDKLAATKFEIFCKNRLGRIIPKCLSGKLSFEDTATLVMAGLIVDPGLTGQVSIFGTTQDDQGTNLKIKQFNRASVAVLDEMKFTANNDRDHAPIIGHEKGLGIPAYILTDSGHDIASIFDDLFETAWDNYLTKLSNYIAPNEIREYRPDGSGKLKLVKRIDTGKAPATC